MSSTQAQQSTVPAAEQKVQDKKNKKQNKDAAISSIIVLLFLVVLFIKFVLPNRVTHKFDLQNNHVTLHINETDQYNDVSRFVEHFHSSLDQSGIQSADISLSSSEFNDEHISHLFSKRLPLLKSLKLNLGSTKLTDKGLEFVLNKIPKNIEDLDISIDHIPTVKSSGAVIAKTLPTLHQLKSLKLSFILSSLKNEGAKAILLGLKSLKKIENLTLVLMGNDLSLQFAEQLKQYLSTVKDNLKTLNLNLFSNKFGGQGIKPVAEAIEQLKNIHSLDLDLYFNNLTEVGAKSISNSLSKLTQLKQLRLNMDFNGITNEGGQHLGNALRNLQNLEVLDLGVATKNFGYLGYKHVVEGLQTLTSLKKLVLRCGVNKVGVNGASVTAQALSRLPELEELSINFLQNYIGDEGASILTNSIVKNLHALRVLHLDIAFNGLQGEGLAKVLRSLAQRRFDKLFVSGSSNQLRNAEVKKLVPELQALLRRNKQFRFQFLNTAITEKGQRLLSKVFQKYPGSLSINTIQLNQQQKKNHPDEKIDYTDPENFASASEVQKDAQKVRSEVKTKIEEAKSRAKKLKQQQVQNKKKQAQKKAQKQKQKRQQQRKNAQKLKAAEQQKKLNEEKLRLQKEKLQKAKLQKQKLQKQNERLQNQKQRLQKQKIQKQKQEKERKQEQLKQQAKKKQQQKKRQQSKKKEQQKNKVKGKKQGQL